MKLRIVIEEAEAEVFYLLDDALAPHKVDEVNKALAHLGFRLSVRKEEDSYTLEVM